MTARSTPRNPWHALIVLCVANFLILLDTTIVNTAIPSIMATLGTGIDSALWVLNGYLLAFASLLIIFGRLGDVLGARPLFVGGLGLFTLASVLCGLSGSPGELVTARVVQGIGAAILVPQALVLISAIFPPDRRGAAFGIFTAVAGIASISGPTLGGLLVTELGWQSIFYLNVPVGLVGIVLAVRLVPDPRVHRPHHFDVVGMLLATCGLLGIVYVLIEGPGHGAGTSATVTALSLACLLLFVVWERRQDEPLVPLALFGSGNFGIATIITAVFSFALYGFLLVFVIETQSALGMSPLRSGIVALPMTVTLSVLAPIAGRITDRVGGRVLLVAGLAFYGLGALAVAFLPTANSTAAVFVAPLVVLGIGIGLSVAPTTTEAMRAVVPEQASAASGVLNAARQVGAVLGATVVGSVLRGGLTGSLHQAVRDRVGQLPAPARDFFVSGFERATGHGLQLGGRSGGVTAPAALSPDLTGQFDRLARDVFTHGLVAASRPALSVVVAVSLLASLLAALTIRRRSPVAPTTTLER